ncbi:hypothetical protein RhiLY_06131 [Ceratobasidium sp. AG-Ba]|nr:hypothetical protein RhiLY_06131 [Ceratobasidium sp. AG-Ba]
MMDHKNDIDFVVNIFSLHNYELINTLVEYHLPGYMRMCVQAASDHEQIRLWAAEETRKPKKPETNENEAEDTADPQQSQLAAGAKTGRKGKSAAKSKSAAKGKGKEKMSTNMDYEATQGGSNPLVVETMASLPVVDTEGDNNGIVKATPIQLRLNAGEAMADLWAMTAKGQTATSRDGRAVRRGVGAIRRKGYGKGALSLKGLGQETTGWEPSG